MSILATGIGTKYGNLWADLLADQYDITCFGAKEHPKYETEVGDRTDYETIVSVVDGHNTILDPHTASSGDGWDAHLRSMKGTHHLLEASRECGVRKFVLGSTNLVVHGYEVDNFPKIYRTVDGLMIDHTTPVYPTMLYGVANAFTENLAEMYARSKDWSVAHLETRERKFPERVSVIRWGVVRPGEYDHPYGDAEKGVDEGRWDRDSRAYDLAAQRMQCSWCSIQDFEQLLRRAIEDESVGYDVFFAVSDNERRWFDLEHARNVLGYEPEDSAEDWNSPPV